MSNNEKKDCVQCKGIKTVILNYEFGQLICEKCGEVFQEGIIADFIERTSKDDNKIERISHPINPLTANECGTNITIKGNGNIQMIVSHSKRTKYDNYSSQIKKILKGKITKSEIQQIIMIFEEMVKKTKEENIRGKNLKKIIIGIYYFFCKKNQNRKTAKDISLLFSNGSEIISERAVKTMYTKIKNNIDPKLEQTEIELIIEEEKNRIGIFIGQNLGGNKDLEKLADNIVENINKKGLLDKYPKTIAGLSLIIACKLLNRNIEKNKEFYNFFSKKNALKTAFNEIKNVLKLIIPQNYSDKIEILLNENIFP